jgi:hypothetical protein
MAPITDPQIPNPQITYPSWLYGTLRFTARHFC